MAGIEVRGAAKVRGDERALAGRVGMFVSLALAPDGTAAGYTQLGVMRFRPWFAYQGDTVVVSAHRGHRLGRWLKAANLRQALGVHPGLREIRTYNAETNPWMLAINVAMGYQPATEVFTYQGSVAGALAHLCAPAGRA